jgi:hypothetical protein
MVYDTGVDWNIHFFSFLFCSNHLVLEDRDHVNIDFGTLDQRCFNKDSNIGTLDQFQLIRNLLTI